MPIATCLPDRPLDHPDVDGQYEMDRDRLDELLVEDAIRRCATVLRSELASIHPLETSAAIADRLARAVIRNAEVIFVEE